MTGEITLSGLVFPVGGIKGKVLAARRAGVKRVVLPKRNEPDFNDIPEESRQGLEAIFVERIDQALLHTLAPAESPEPAPEAQEPAPKTEPVTTGTEVGFGSGEA
jgi:ATP-dependent Lon protease